MRKSRILLMFIMLLAFSLAAFTTSAQDDASVFSPTFLEDSVVVTDSFDADVAMRLYAFFGSEGDVVSVGMQPGSDAFTLFPQLILLGADGALVAASVESSDGLSALIQNVELPDTSYYFVIAANVLTFSSDPDDNADVNEYQIAVVGITGQPDSNSDSEFDATEFELGTQSTLTITPETPVAYALFLGNEGDSVDVQATSDSDGVDTLVYLFDFEGNRLAVNDDVDLMNGDTSSLIADVELPYDGLYLAVITAYNYPDALDPNWENYGQIDVSISG